MEKENAVNIADIDFSSSAALGVSIRADPESSVFSDCSEYTALVLKKLSLFDIIAKHFREKGYGEEHSRDLEGIHLLCSFPLTERETFVKSRLQPLIENIGRETSCRLICGIGIIAVNRLHTEESLQTSVKALNLNFFEEGDFFDYQKDFRRSHASLESYEIYSEQAFRAILSKAPDALEKIDSCIDIIGKIHYGNKQAATMRAMNFTGEIAHRLYRYSLLDTDFYMLQDALQEKVLQAENFKEVKNAVHDYYSSLIAEINSKSRTGRKTVIEQVKAYIRENYMNELSTDDLADIACVSPGYFSHMFKNETGTNYKAFLTQVRMDAASELLLSSDLSVY